MYSIREGVFETNSSSSHSITLGGEPLLNDTLHLDKDGLVVINGGHFGWGIESYNDACTKAAYCVTYLSNGNGFVDYENPLTSMLIKVVKDRTNAKEVQLNVETDDYIDHQSSEVCSSVFADEVTLSNFIFNSDSVLLISNDNQ